MGVLLVLLDHFFDSVFQVSQLGFVVLLGLLAGLSQSLGAFPEIPGLHDTDWVRFLVTFSGCGEPVCPCELGSV